jgi:voltage-gated potassium channel
MKKKIRKNSHSRFFIIKEVALTSLAIFSVLMLIFEIIKPLTEEQQKLLISIDFTIACIFLLDFFIELLVAKNRKAYLRRNWFLPLASIPLTYNITEALRGLRALRLIRIVRAGEHLDFEFINARANKPSRSRKNRT